MAGRRRRASNSTVETVDHDQLAYVDEAAVLKPLAPLTPDSDWPGYVMNEATVYRQDGKSLGNPLVTDYEGPVIVRGMLDIDELEDKDAVKHGYKGRSQVYMQIASSHSYSIGLSEEGFPALWVSGGAGWFEILPSRRYKATFSHICDAIYLYYGALEAYVDYGARQKRARRSKQSLAPPSLDHVFFKAAVWMGNGMVRDELEARCHQFAPFLLAHFPKEKEVWGGTLFSEWLAASHPELKARLDEATTAAVEGRLAGYLERYGPLDGVVVEDDALPRPRTTETTAPAGRGRGRASGRGRKRDRAMADMEDVDMVDASVASPHPSRGRRSGATAETPFPRETMAAPPHRNLPLRSPATSTKPQPAPSVPAVAPHADLDVDVDDNDDVDLSRLAVDRILAVLSDVYDGIDPKRVSEKKVLSDIYFACKFNRADSYTLRARVVGFFARPLLARLPSEWHGTRLHAWLRETAKTEPRMPAPDYTLQILVDHFERRKKAQVGPEPPPPPTPTPAPSLPAHLRTRQHRTSSTDDVDEQPGSRKTAGKSSGLRPQVGRKRPAPLDAEDDHPRASKAHKPDGECSVAEALDADSPVFGDDGDGDASEPPPDEAVRLVLRADAVPTLSPTGPNGTWVCDQAGCGHVVRGANDDDDGEALVREHYALHEEQARKMRLAQQESRGVLPISNLLERLRVLGRNTAQRATEAIAGQTVPRPIKRRLLV